jgi:ABC-2 type transport system permease protein
LLLDPVKTRTAIEVPYDVAAMVLIITAFIVGLFYCLDALYGERRDRSILFWKSLPVSDLTTVLSKATIALVVLPLVTFAVIVATQFVMLLWTSVLLISHGMSQHRRGTISRSFSNHAFSFTD